MTEPTYTNDGNGHTVRIGGRAIGRVRKSGMYWHAYKMTGENVRGTFLSMSAAGQRLVDRDREERTS